MIHCLCDVLWQCCDYGMSQRRQIARGRCRVRNGNIVFFIWCMGLQFTLIMITLRERDRRGYRIHTHTHIVTTLLKTSFSATVVEMWRSFFAHPDWKVLRCHRSSLHSCKTQRVILLNRTKILVCSSGSRLWLLRWMLSVLLGRSDLPEQMVYRHHTSKLFIIIKMELFTSWSYSL